MATAPPVVVASDQSVLSLLRQMPTVSPFVTYTWPPRGFSVRVGKIYVAIFMRLFQLLDSDGAFALVEEQVRLLLAISLLILRLPEGTEAGDEPLVSNATRKMLLRRVQLAEMGDWRTLISEYLQAVHTRANSEQVDQEIDEHTRLRRLFSRVVTKVIGGCDRAAHRLLAGAAKLLPSRATLEAVKKLFQVAPQAPPRQRNKPRSWLSSVRQSLASWTVCDVLQNLDRRR